ncbi:hypothetical protein J8I87_27585 [Paraburkholderia sp. LEh10]|uniref:hypothetical protein n=1 Tax=Paraburkholderia sp. LEh10 TaxID=2821353 RepID=UPI001AE35743|nr:hypothetical protein [Paraburkholderia sp. LEh10]MBP0593391.1 hypothetical protein [Paraburkholderia sp. LEh10]
MRIRWQSRFSLGIAALLIVMAPAGKAVGEEGIHKSVPAGQFSGTSVTQTKAIIFEIDAERNSVTLLQENGEPIDVIVDRSAGNVNALKPGDAVSITYSRALLLRAEKASSNGIRERVDSGFTTAQSLGSSLAMHRVQAVTTVERIDRGKRQLTLRGATRTVTLEATSDSLLDGLKVGDSVRVDFVEATAIRISRDGNPLN